MPGDGERDDDLRECDVCALETGTDSAVFKAYCSISEQNPILQQKNQAHFPCKLTKNAATRIKQKLTKIPKSCIFWTL
jgi:hypothetical protein